MTKVICENRKIYAEPDEESTELIEKYLQALKNRNLSPKTIRGRETAIRYFLDYAAGRDVYRFREVTADFLNQYNLWMKRKQKYKESTIEGRLGTIRAFFSFLTENAVLFDNPAREIVLRRPAQLLPKIISVDEIRALLAEPDCLTPAGLRDRAIMETLYSTGMRREELAKLTIFDVDIERRNVKVKGKGSKERMLPLGRQAAFYIAKYLKIARPELRNLKFTDTIRLWLNMNGKPLRDHSVTSLIREYRIKAGIRKEVTPHTIRRSCATHMLNNGAHPLMISKLLGHSRIGTLTRYLRVAASELKRNHLNSKLGK